MKTDFSKYTIKGLLAMAKDAGIKGMSKATREELEPVLADTDLSELDLDSYPMKKEIVIAVPLLNKSVTGRRSAKRSNFGRR